MRRWLRALVSLALGAGITAACAETFTYAFDTAVILWTGVTNSVSDDGALKTGVIPINPIEAHRFFRLRE